MNTWHESRLWSGRDKERFEDCDCTEQPCGYVVPSESCPQHSMTAGKTLRRAHRAFECTGAPQVTNVMPAPMPTRTER